MKYIKSLALLIVAMIATACTTFTDEPGGGQLFIPYDVVDCTITATVINNPLSLGNNSKVWSVSEMTVYRDWRVSSADGKLTLIKEEKRTETFSSTSPCYVALPNGYQGQLGDKVENLPLQMVIEKGTLNDTKNIVTLGSVIKELTKEELGQGGDDSK